MRICFLGIVSMILALSGCRSQSGLAHIGESGRNFDAPKREYRLGPGDQLRILVYGEEDLSGEFVIDESGQISLPLIGMVKAGNLNVKSLQKAVEARLKGRYLKNPRVSAEVLHFRPYYIMGEVKSPGEYPYTAGLTLSRAVAAAGGFTYRANIRSIRIKRAGVREADHLRFSATMPINPGDEIEIAERLF